jgi:Cellulase (glycosyl hydrolase family 5)
MAHSVAVGRMALLLLSLLTSPLCAAPWIASVDQDEGLPTVSIGGAVVASGKFVFWRKDWAWSGLATSFKVLAPFNYEVSGKNQGLNFDLNARITKPSDRQLVWAFDLDARSTTSDAIGGGMSFRFDLANVGARLGEPELLPANRGWAWGKPGGVRMEMRFDPPLAAVYFERGQKSEIRAYFYQGEVPQGQRRYIANLTLVGDMAVGPTTAERFGLDDPNRWPTAIMDWPIAPWNISPVDLSFLNSAEKPAGKRGFLKADGERLMFADGTPARFWGTNLTAWALFGTDRENVKQQARRLSELGFNLVRLHHHDSFWVSPNIFGDSKQADTKALNPLMLEKLDWWIKCLKDEGIYVWLDLHVQRNFKPADGITDFDEIAKGKPTADLKGFNYVNASIQEAMRRFNEAYVSHLNPFTGLRYQDDPAIIAFLLTNENDVTSHFGNALLPDKKVPRHNAIYMREAETFAAKQGLPKDKTWRSWEYGPSKIFLNELEHRFDADMIRHLRALGAKAPIVTTASWGNNPISSLPALTTGDIIAVHSYGGGSELEKNPLYGANFMHWIAAAQVAGRPLSVPEWNISPFPAPDRHTTPLYIAGSASLQGWDAVMQYAYSQEALSSRGSPSNWHAFNDPALIATLPAAALAYRRGDVQEARSTYVFAPGRTQLYDRMISPANSVALRTAAEKGKLVIALPRTPELPWLAESAISPGANVITDPTVSLIEPNAGAATSDTGELTRDWEQGIYTIDTPRTQAAMGFIGGRAIALKDVEIAAETHNATVAVQSLDGKPISASRNILISLGARSMPESAGQPFRSEPVMGRVSIRAAPGLKVYRQHGLARDAREIAAQYQNGRYHVALERSLASYWLILR